MGSREQPARPAGIDRRRLLVGLGFGAANAALLRRLPAPAAGGATAAGEWPALPGVPVLAGSGAGPAAPDPGHEHDLVIRGGRVMDPASGFDRVADVGIDGSRVAGIGPRLRGRRELDARDRVVAPGFVDLLSYDPNPVGIWLKVADGVTTNLGMHGINGEAAPWFERLVDAGVPTHFGGAFDEPWARAELGIAPDRAASPEQVAELVVRAQRGLAEGWIGIDLELEYTPGVERAEVEAMGAVAAAAGVPVFFHGRHSDVEPPGTNADTLAEIVAAARATGAAVHVQHLVSTGGTFSMEASIATLEAARAEGIDVTACTYPYHYWATYLGSPRFADGWQERYRISYDDLELPGTGERLTAATFDRYRAENRLAVAYAIPEADVRRALACPWVMLGSDGIIEPGANNHPRGAGTFARTLGRYVREEGVLSLMEALAKMTSLPAARLEGRAPALRRKGRLQVGADADVCVFDPDGIEDRATVADPAQPSRGIDWVLVEGRVVKDPDGPRHDELPGAPIRMG